MPENTRLAFQQESANEHLTEGENNRHDETKLSNQESYRMLWDTIFVDYKWIDGIVRDLSAKPFLIGTRLDALHLEHKDHSKPLYAALISGDISGDVTYTKDLFFSCLKPHKLVEGTDEILFDSGIILNISDILDCPELIPVDIKQLLYDRDRLGSTYSFWGDVDGALRRLEPASLTLTKSRIPGDEEHFWILKLKSNDRPLGLEVFLGDWKKSEYGVYRL
jgi:hypothetical protein